MVKISDFYGNWIIENRTSIFYESTFIIISENKLLIYLGPINYVRANSFYDRKFTYDGKNTNISVSFKLIGNELYIKDKDDNVLIC